MTSRRITDKRTMMLLSGRWFFLGMLLLVAVGDWIELPIDRADWHFDASICSIHFLLTVLADGHD